MNQGAIPRVVVGDPYVRAVRSDPGAVSLSRIDDLSGAVVTVESRCCVATGNCRDAQLPPDKCRIPEEDQSSHVESTGRAEVNVSILPTKYRSARLLQRRINDALKSWCRTERPCPEARAELHVGRQSQAEPDHSHRTVGRDRDLWFAVPVRARQQCIGEGKAADRSAAKRHQSSQH